MENSWNPHEKSKVQNIAFLSSKLIFFATFVFYMYVRHPVTISCSKIAQKRNFDIFVKNMSKFVLKTSTKVAHLHYKMTIQNIFFENYALGFFAIFLLFGLSYTSQTMKKFFNPQKLDFRFFGPFWGFIKIRTEGLGLAQITVLKLRL